MVAYPYFASCPGPLLLSPFASLSSRDLADMACEDRSTVSKVAVDGVMQEAAIFQKKYESQETLDAEARSVGGSTQ